MASVTSIAARITAAQHPRAHGRLHARKLQRRTPSAAATDATDAAAEGEALWADDRVPVTVITGFLVRHTQRLTRLPRHAARQPRGAENIAGGARVVRLWRLARDARDACTQAPFQGCQ